MRKANAHIPARKMQVHKRNCGRGSRRPAGSMMKSGKCLCLMFLDDK